MAPRYRYNSSSTSVTASRLFCSFLTHGSFWRHTLLQSPCTRSLLAFALIQHSRTRPLLAVPPPFRSLLAHPFAGFSHTIACGSFRLFTVFSRTPSQASHTRSLVAAFAFSQSRVHPFAGFSHTTACGSFRLFTVFSRTPLQAPHKITCGRSRLFTGFSRTPSQASRKRSLVAAFAFTQSSRAPLRRLLTHDRFWQLSPFYSLLAYPFAGFSHMIACGSFRLSTVSSRTPSQASYTRSLVRAFVFAVFLHTVAFGSFRFWQPSRTRSLLAAVVFS